MELILLTLLSLSTIALVEVVKRAYRLPASVTRRVVHAATAMVAAVAPLFVSKEEVIAVSVLFALLLLFSYSRRLLSSIHDVERKTLGEVWLPCGVAITAMLFLPESLHAYQFGVLVLGIADPLAGLIGELRRKQHPAPGKTVAGSTTFFLVCAALTSLFAPQAGPYLVLVPLLLTATEFVLIFGLDNLVLPIVAAYAMQWLTL